MDKLVIKGGSALNGSVAASGSKNSCLPLMFSALLCDGEHVFRNVPALKDVESSCELLRTLGCEVTREQDLLRIRVSPCEEKVAPYDLVRKMRASILCLGPLLARYGEAKVSLPGGCAIGTRPIDLHLEALTAMGAEIQIEQGYVIAKAKKLIGTEILFEQVTVGGTENIMMAAALAEGVTLLENAAKEPEIVDLANYLKSMGVKISGAGTSIIRIEGGGELRPAEHNVIPDRIEAGTLLIAGAMGRGEVTVTDCLPSHFDALIQKLKESGFSIDRSDTSVTVRGQNDFQSVDITTAAYPLFPTDLQAQFMTLMTQATGTSVISETVFENRFMHVQELVRLNADITPKTHVAVVRGGRKLKGAPVMATDLRASASLALAGLVAEGETEVKRIYHLDRGYENLAEKLTSLGANLKRVRE